MLALSWRVTWRRLADVGGVCTDSRACIGGDIIFGAAVAETGGITGISAELRGIPGRRGFRFHFAFLASEKPFGNQDQTADHKLIISGTKDLMLESSVKERDFLQGLEDAAGGPVFLLERIVGERSCPTDQNRKWLTQHAFRG
jgi:hypothetical protein